MITRVRLQVDTFTWTHFRGGKTTMQISELEKNKAVVMRYVDEIQNGHSIDAIESVFAEDFVDHMASSGGLFLGGMDGLKQGYATFLNAFPDLHVTVENLIAEGDKVVAFKTLRGTHRGTHLGIPATGKSVEYQIISIYGIKNGKMAEFWGLQDEFVLRQQLGVIKQDDINDSD
jgi:steroid delta-isomerase-like uncharacterized protein